MATLNSDPMAMDNPGLGLQDEKSKKLHEWGKALHHEGLQRRRHWEGIWWENLATFTGDYWVQWDPHHSRLAEPVKKPEHRVRIPINLAQPVLRTELAKLTKNRPILDVMSRSNDQSDLDSAKVGDKILNNYVERQFHMARVRRRALQWVTICGLGGILNDWDKTALGQINVLHDDEGNPIFDPRAIDAFKQQAKEDNKDLRSNYQKIPQGEMISRHVSPFEIMWDFSEIYIEDSWWCIYSRVMDCDEVFRRWGVVVAPESNVLPGVIERRILEKFDLTGKMGIHSSNVQQLCQVHQMWVKQGHPRFPNGLCMVFTKDVCLECEDYSYDYGLPVNLMGHIPLPISQYPMSVLQHIRGPVVEISKTVSQLIENRNLMANPPWLIPKQIQLATPIVNKPGARIEFTYMPNIPEPKPVEMPDMPNYVTQLVEMMKEVVLEIGGQGETSQGRVPPGARSGVAIAYLQEEDDTRLGVTVQEFEELMEATGDAQLQIIARHYTTPRIINIYKKRSVAETINFVGTQLAGVAGVICQAGSALPRSKAARQQYILDLWDRKLEQDPRKVREMLELAEGEPDEWEVDLDQAERENFAMMNGEEKPVLEWYNHPAHHYKHRNYMKSAEFEALSPDIQKIFMDHDEEHTYWEEVQAQQVSAMQAQGGQGAPPQGQGGSSNGAAPPNSSVPAGANGQNVPEGPPPQFTSTSPSDFMSQQPQ